MGQESRSVTVDHTADFRLANLAIIVVVWLGWVVYSVLKPTVEMVPSGWGPYIIASALFMVFIAALYWTSGSTIGTISAVGIACITLVIGIVVVANLQSSLSTTGLTNQQGSELMNTFSTSFGAFALIPMLVLVLVAVVIMALLMWGASGRYSEGLKKTNNKRNL